mmetsp:Transcript_44362/g.109892  ORF Transcript_44362/g.109892 Transcript_44362/m.109892 type:complete len:221 (-) Transcript_44362:116-778(-)
MRRLPTRACWQRLLVSRSGRPASSSTPPSACPRPTRRRWTWRARWGGSARLRGSFRPLARREDSGSPILRRAAAAQAAVAAAAAWTARCWPLLRRRGRWVAAPPHHSVRGCSGRPRATHVSTARTRATFVAPSRGGRPCPRASSWVPARWACARTRRRPRHPPPRAGTARRATLASSRRTVVSPAVSYAPSLPGRCASQDRSRPALPVPAGRRNTPRSSK